MITQLKDDRSSDSAPDSRRSYNTVADGIADVVALLWPARRLLRSAAIRGLCAGIAVGFLISNTYESTTRLMPPDQARSLGISGLLSTSERSQGGLGAAAELLGAGHQSGNLFLAVLHSNTVLDRIVRQFDLYRVYREDLPEEARGKLLSHTTVTQDTKSGVITISIRDKDPSRAAAMARAYVEELNRVIVGQSTSDARRERVFLESRLNIVHADLASASRDLSEFASRNTTLDPQIQGKAAVESAAMLQGEIIASKSELQQLEQIYTPSNTRVRSVRARLTALESELQTLIGKAGGSIRGSSYSSSASGSVPIEDISSEAISPAIRQLPELGATYAELFRRVKMQEAILEVLTKEYELAKVQEAKEIPTVEMLDSPEVPLRHVSPNRLLLAMAGLLAGIALAVAFTLARRHWEMLEESDPQKRLVISAVNNVRRGLQRIGMAESRFGMERFRWRRLR